MENSNSGYSSIYTETGGFAVLIEWDGKRPPTRWYDRLRSLGYHISGDKEKTPLVRRESRHQNGVAFQEGALLCKEASEARSLAFLAHSCGARNALVITYSALDTSAMDDKDEQALARMQTVLGRKGRPPKATPRVVICQDCGKSSPVSGVGFRCDHCGGMDIVQRDGEWKTVKLPQHQQGSIEGWYASRLVEGWYEEPNLKNYDDPDAVLLDTTLPMPDSVSAILFTRAHGSAKRALDNSAITWREYYRMLDIIRLVLNRDPERRLRDRIGAIQKYIRFGGDMTGVILAIGQQMEVDLLDCAAVSDDLPWRLIRAGYAR